VFLITGALLVGVAAWFIAHSLADRALKKRLSEQDERLRTAESTAAAAEAIIEELRSQSQRRDEELKNLRDTFEVEMRDKTDTLARLEESQKNLKEQRELVEKMESKINETFKSLSLEALSKNTSEFLKLADKAFKSQADLGKQELEGKKELIDQNLESISKKLYEMQKKFEEIGQGSIEKIREVSNQIKSHAEVTSKLSDTTDNLRHTLASARKRGEWGERMAEDVIRLVGMVEGVNYIKQKMLDHAPGRPDYTFFLPNNLKVNMDVKFPMDNYVHYLEAQNDNERKRHKDDLLRNARGMIKNVTTREYINPSGKTVDYVIVFIPNEQVYSFINESDTSIMDESLKQKVILCSPFTLYAVLAVIRQAVENFNLEQTASEILRLIGDFYKQWKLFKDRFKTMGDRLDAARKEYDALMTTRSNQLERPLKKIDELRKQKAIEFEGAIEVDENSLD
jgi:DNA recombination protein RmuC